MRFAFHEYNSNLRLFGRFDVPLLSFCVQCIYDCNEFLEISKSDTCSFHIFKKFVVKILSGLCVVRNFY